MDITTSILLTVVLLILTVCLYSWLFASSDYWTSRGIPCLPGRLSIISNSLSIIGLQNNISIIIRAIYEAYPGKSMVGCSLKDPVLMVRDPELIKAVLQTNFHNFQMNTAKLDLVTDPLLGHDPFFAEGAAWKNSRASFVAAFSAKRIRNTSLVIINVCKKLEDYLAEKTKNREFIELEGKLLFSRFTAEVAAGSVFGIEGNSFKDDYKGTLLDHLKMIVDPKTSTALRYNIIFFWPTIKKLFKTGFVPLEVDKYFRRIVKDLEGLRKKDDVEKTDVLQLMLDMEKNGKFERITTLGHTFSFLFESFETSSLQLSSMSYFIAKHQEVQDRLRAEIETVLANHESQLNYDAINEMTYLDQVMNETFRIFPVAATTAKRCKEAYRLEGSDGLTLDVEPGTTILIPIWGLHMDPKIWENPEEFNPERFRKDKVDARHKFVHLPFSKGPRSCPGQRLAVIQIKAAISTVIRNYRMELSPKVQEPIRMDPLHFLFTPVGGFWIRLRPLK